MSTTKTIAVELEPEEYQRLEDEARRRGTTPGELARDYLRERLGECANAQEAEEKKRQVALAALARLAELTADLPPIDAVQIARESREDLERRFPLP